MKLTNEEKDLLKLAYVENTLDKCSIHEWDLFWLLIKDRREIHKRLKGI